MVILNANSCISEKSTTFYTGFNNRVFVLYINNLTLNGTVVKTDQNWHVLSYINFITKMDLESGTTMYQGEESIEISVDDYNTDGFLSGKNLSWSYIRNYDGNPDYPSINELNEMFDITFESHINSLKRDFKINNILK